MTEAKSIPERARAYLDRLPVGVSGTNRHAATFLAASVLVNGFGLSEGEAWPLLQEFNARCLPPSDPKKLQYRLRRAIATGDRRGRGYLLKNGGRFLPSRSQKQLEKLAHVPEPPKPLEFDAAALARIAKPWRHVDLRWLADRSEVDPATVTSAGFLSMLYEAGERVKIFTDDKSQGQALWPCPPEKIPSTGKCGVWFLAAPVDGKSYPNPRVPPNEDGTAKMSSRSEESVTSWRWMMIESDEANTRDWLGAIVQMPLRIAALYTSGSRSVHALVRIDARTKTEWDGEKVKMKSFLKMLGADLGALSAVRLTRLPGCWRQGKMKTVRVEGGRAREVYVPLATPEEPRGVYQKLLYINPRPQLRPLIDMPELRETEKIWLDHAAAGVADSDESGGEWLKHGLWYYAPCSAACREALQRLNP